MKLPNPVHSISTFSLHYRHFPLCTVEVRASRSILGWSAVARARNDRGRYTGKSIIAPRINYPTMFDATRAAFHAFHAEVLP